MTLDERETLQRFHEALVREIRERGPEQLLSPFTVAEIYQDLVPYRTHRDELGVEMNADYEYALLRLLSGEGDFLFMDSPRAREELRKELESPNPNTGLYREYAAAEVRLNQELIGEESSGPEHGPTKTTEAREADYDRVETAGSVGATEASLDPATPEGLLDEEAEPPEGLADEETDAGEDSDVVASGHRAEEDPGLPFDTCPWCKENLPQRPGVRFCPFCGSNVRLVPCPACGEELELNWRFCVACGTEVAQ